MQAQEPELQKSRPASQSDPSSPAGQGDRPLSLDADDQPEKWRAALFRAGGWAHKGSAEEREEREGSTARSSSAGGDEQQLEHVVSLLGFGRFQETSLLILISMQLVDGMDATLWWTFEEVMRERWGVTNAEYRVGCCVAVFFLGLGSFFGGRLTDEYGRHFMLFFSGAAYLCAAFLSCVSFNQYCLLVLRCICSAALGCRLSATMTLAVELLPCTWRARGAILLPGVGGTMGCVVILLVWEMARWTGLATMTHGWRLVLLCPVLIDGIVFYFFRNNMAESPFFLRQHGRMRECRALLTEIAEINDVVLPDDEVAISCQVEMDDPGASCALSCALKRTRYAAVVMWVASAVGSAVMISELVEDEGVVFNRFGSLGSVPHGFQMALVYVAGAYLSLVLLELRKGGFLGVLLMIILPSLTLSITVTLVSPSHGTGPFVAAVVLALVQIMVFDISLSMTPLAMPTATRGSGLGAAIAATHLAQATTTQLVMTEALNKDYVIFNMLVMVSSAICLGTVLWLAVASDGVFVTLGALDTADHELAVMQGGATGPWWFDSPTSSEDGALFVESTATTSNSTSNSKREGGVRGEGGGFTEDAGVSEPPKRFV
jgi:MFS family permease